MIKALIHQIRIFLCFISLLKFTRMIAKAPHIKPALDSVAPRVIIQRIIIIKLIHSAFSRLFFEKILSKNSRKSFVARLRAAKGVEEKLLGSKHNYLVKKKVLVVSDFT